MSWPEAITASVAIVGGVVVAVAYFWAMSR